MHGVFSLINRVQEDCMDFLSVLLIVVIVASFIFGAYQEYKDRQAAIIRQQQAQTAIFDIWHSKEPLCSFTGQEYLDAFKPRN